MQLVWVNHAAFIVRSGAVSLLFDPWIEGTSFNRGWSLLSRTQLSYDDFAGITHIWISNERSDHFHAPTLEKIPEQYRRKIKVLFHHTKQRPVLKLCTALGFPVEEVPEGQAVEIGPDFKLMSGIAGVTDSWSAVWAEGKALLNTNDCVFERQRELDKVKQHVGQVDVLLSQFSYGHWVGNPGDRAGHKKHANHILAEMCRQIRAFQPRHFIPSASYFFFSHEENSHMNAGGNRIGDVFDYLIRELNIPSLVLYPGDHWEVGALHDSAESIRRYNEDFSRAMRCEPTKAAPVEVRRLQEAGRAFAARSSEKNHQLFLNTLPPAVVYVPDLDVHLEFASRTTLKVVEGRQPDIILSSDSLLNCLTTESGGETLVINGRFQVPPGGRLRRFFWICRIPKRKSAGTAVNLKFLAHHTAEKVQPAMRGQ